jgi:hypothetical protein
MSFHEFTLLKGPFEPKYPKQNRGRVSGIPMIRVMSYIALGERAKYLANTRQLIDRDELLSLISREIELPSPFLDAEAHLSLP